MPETPLVDSAKSCYIGKLVEIMCALNIPARENAEMFGFPESTGICQYGSVCWLLRLAAG